MLGDDKVGCVFPIIIVSILHDAGFRPSDLQEDASLFTREIVPTFNEIPYEKNDAKDSK